MPSLPPLPCEQAGGKFSWWIRSIIFLQTVSALVSQLRPEDAWIVHVTSSVFAATFILHLSWILLSRHVVPFWMQDYSVARVWMACQERLYETRNVLVECIVRANDAVWYYCLERVVHGVSFGCVNRIRHYLSRNSRRDTGHIADANFEIHHQPQSSMVVEMVSAVAQESLSAPTLDVMERLDGSNETAATKEDEQVSPRLQDKKKW